MRFIRTLLDYILVEKKLSLEINISRQQKTPLDYPMEFYSIRVRKLFYFKNRIDIRRAGALLNRTSSYIAGYCGFVH